MIHWIDDLNLNFRREGEEILQFRGKLVDFSEFKKAYPNNKHILSFDDVFRLDNSYGGKFGDKANNYTTWAKLLTFEPTNYYKSNEDNLLGAEMLLWTDLVTEYNVFNKIWPKLSSFSEIFWSAPVSPGSRIWDEQIQKMLNHRSYLELGRIRSDRISSRYCEDNSSIVFSASSTESEYNLEGPSHVSEISV